MVLMATLAMLPKSALLAFRSRENSAMDVLLGALAGGLDMDQN